MSMIDDGKPVTRKVGIGLGIGIFLLPIVFAWFTLRKGHSTLSRVVAFAWLILPIAASLALRSMTPKPVAGAAPVAAAPQ